MFERDRGQVYVGPPWGRRLALAAALLPGCQLSTFGLSGGGVTVANTGTTGGTTDSTTSSTSGPTSTASSSETTTGTTGTTGTTAAPTTTTGVAPVCGDGTVDAEEECDDGNVDNSDACLDTCVAASCGDGFRYAGQEACDGADVGGELCSNLGFPAGMLACDASCQIDTSMCQCGLDPVPLGGECPAECTGGCAEDTCTIDCGGNGTCEGATVACPAGWACDVVCDGYNSCASAQITCPDHACSVTCTNTSACKSTTIDCGEGSCSLVCNIGNSVCLGAMFNCGLNNGAIDCLAPMNPPTLVPDAQSQCECVANGCG